MSKDKDNTAVDSSKWTGGMQEQQAERFRLLGELGYSVIASHVLGPFSDAGKSLVGGFFQRRMEKARDILIETLEEGEITPEELEGKGDAAIRMAIRFYLAVNKGAQNRNLKLLARALRHSLFVEGDDGDQFDQYAIFLESLTDKEIAIVAGLYQHRENSQPAERWREIGKELIPEVFSDEPEMSGYASMALRSGLVGLQMGFDGPFYTITSLGIRVCRFALSD